MDKLSRKISHATANALFEVGMPLEETSISYIASSSDTITKELKLPTFAQAFDFLKSRGIDAQPQRRAMNYLDEVFDAVVNNDIMELVDVMKLVKGLKQ